MKKIIFSIVAIAIMTTGVLSGCQPNIGGSGTSGFVASGYTMGYGAYSTASILSTFGGMTSDNNLLGNSNTSSNLLLGSETVQPDTDQLNDYYNMLAPFLANETDEIINYTDLSGADPNYEVVMEVKFSLGTGQAQVMTLKYNVGQAIEDDEEEDYDDEYEAEEIESRFEGVLILGGNTYDFVGKSEVEDDEEEFELKAVIDAQNYVRMSVEREEGELEYHYEISENGIVKITQIEIEDEEDKEFKIELQIEENGVEKEYTLKTEIENGIEVTKMTYDVDGQEGQIYIEKLAGLDGILGTEDDTVQYTIQEPGKLEVVVEEEIDNDFGDVEDDD